MATDMETTHVTPSYGNIFFDLEFDKEEAEKLLMDADRVIDI